MKVLAFLVALFTVWAIACVAWMALRYTPAGGDSEYVFLWDRWENRMCLVSISEPAHIICDLRSLWVESPAKGGPTARRP